MVLVWLLVSKFTFAKTIFDFKDNLQRHNLKNCMDAQDCEQIWHDTLNSQASDAVLLV